jgi:hypothetical protein
MVMVTTPQITIFNHMPRSATNTRAEWVELFTRIERKLLHLRIFKVGGKELV